MCVSPSDFSRRTMSLEIIAIDVLPAREEATAHYGSTLLTELPHFVPPAPPAGLPVGMKVWESQDQDSGCGSFGDGAFFDDLPGCSISDDEFVENFAVASSRRSSSSSHGLTITTIPEPPPPPPVQFFLPRFVDELTTPAAIVRRGSIPDLYIHPRPNLLRSLSFSDSSLHELDDDDRLYELNLESGTCIVCYDTGTNFTKRLCCREIICELCLTQIIHTRLNEGLIEFPCPNPECSDPIGRTEVLYHLNREDKERFERLRVNAESDGNRKTCPHCSRITEHTLPSRKMGRYREEDVKIECENCRIEWCFKCHAPWHKDISCKAFVRGNRQFQKWTKGRPNGVANCQKCPTCRVFIQRSTGCDHMTCNRCRTHFCYKCGGRFIEMPGLGDHYQRMSIFGCSYNYLSDQPAKRKAIRGGYFGAKMATLTGYPVLFVAGVAVLVVVGAVALPIYGSYRLYKFKKNTNRLRRRHRRHF